MIGACEVKISLGSLFVDWPTRLPLSLGKTHRHLKFAFPLYHATITHPSLFAGYKVFKFFRPYVEFYRINFLTTLR